MRALQTFVNIPQMTNFFIQFITNEQEKLLSFTWEGSISRILTLAVPEIFFTL